MKARSGGRPPKDAPITNNFNQTKIGAHATKKEILAAKRAMRMETQRQEYERQKQQIDLDKLAGIVKKAQEKVGVPDEQAEDGEEEQEELGEPVPKSKIAPDDDEKSAQQMLQHLRYAYRNAVGPTGKKGRARLVELMENDGEFKFAVKELMKIESSLLAAKIRKADDGRGGVGQQNFFVVLKGLEDEKKYLGAGRVDKTVDMKQIQRAINPDMGEVYEAEEEEVSQRGAPEQLQKPVESVEGW